MFLHDGQPVKVDGERRFCGFRFMGFQRRHIDVAEIDINIATLLAIWQDSLIILPVKFSVLAAQAVVTVAGLKASSDPTTSRAPFLSYSNLIK